MNYGKKNLFILISLLVFSSCQKEKTEQGQFGMQVYNLSSDKCTVTPDQHFLLSGKSTLAKVDVNGNILWKISNHESDYTLPLLNNQFIGCVDDETFLTVTQYNSEAGAIGSKQLAMSDHSRIANPKIIELSTGDLFFIGTSFHGVDSLFSIIKTDKDLHPIWNKKIKIHSNCSVITSIKEINSSGTIILIGNTEKQGGKNKIIHALIDSSGTLMWDQQKIFGIWENYATDIHQVNASEFVITGYFDQGGDIDFNYQFYAYRIDNVGNAVGFYSSGQTKQDYCLASIFVPGNNSLILIGMEGRGKDPNDLNLSNVKIVTVTSPFFTPVSNVSYAKLQSCTGMCAIHSNDGSISLIGRKYAFENKNIQNAFFLKIKPDGTY